MSLVSLTTGSDGVTAVLSGSGFTSLGPSNNPDTNFNSKIYVVSFRSVDNPSVNYGLSLAQSAIFGPNQAGFNSTIYLPKAEIPSGLYNLEVAVPNQAAPLRLLVNISGSVATSFRAGMGTGSIPFTPQYQDVINVPQFGRATAPFGASTGTPEFGYGSGSIVG
jgi:hypothetical protein